MVLQTKISTRPVTDADRNQLAHLIHFGTYVHRHLDWRPPLEWIGEEPFFIAESHNRVVAALACPPDPPQIAWVRMFVCSTRIAYSYAWENLWPQTQAYLRDTDTLQAAAIPLQKWFRELLAEHGFVHNHNVITLAWDPEPGKLEGIPSPKPYTVREMNEDDLPAVFRIDSSSFDRLWRNAAESIRLAYDQSVHATVVEDGDTLVGYQITTRTPYGAHLGRLATSTAHQNQGIGYALLHELVSRLSSHKIPRISVNTQDNNLVSLGLYKKVGFQETQEAYPVFLFQFD